MFTDHIVFVVRFLTTPVGLWLPSVPCTYWYNGIVG